MTAALSPPLLDERTAGADASAAVLRCVLDDQPGYLAPLAKLPRRLSRNRLALNPRCRFSWSHGTPQEAAEAAAFLSCEESDLVVWVPLPTAWHPFWIGDACRELLNRLRDGGPPPANLPVHAVRALRQANILVSANDEASSTKRVQAAIAKSSRGFRRHRYANVSGLIHPFHLDALRKYYRRLIRCGGMYLGDGQISSRYVSHNEPVSRFYHHQLTRTISAIVGEPVKPSYTYVVSYQGGSELEKHVDREQCEFSVSLLVDYPPEREQDAPWPLCLDSGASTAAMTQQVGDALLFCGRELPHWRPKLPEGCTSTSMLLHYVREDFAGTLD